MYSIIKLMYSLLPFFLLNLRNNFICIHLDSPPFEQFYGKKWKEHPRFFDGNYKEATEASHEQGKPLAVYIHSENHENTERFCSYAFFFFPLSFPFFLDDVTGML